MVNPLVTQQKALQMLPRLGQHTDCRRPRSHQIAHRFMASAGDPDRRQLAGTVQLRKRQGIAAIGLDPIAGLHRDQRGRHHHAAMAATGQQTVKLVPARTGFLAEAETTTAFTKPGRHLDQTVGASLKNAELPHLTISSLRQRDAHGSLVNVQSDVCDFVHQAVLHA